MKPYAPYKKKQATEAAHLIFSSTGRKIYSSSSLHRFWLAPTECVPSFTPPYVGAGPSTNPFVGYVLLIDCEASRLSISISLTFTEGLT